MYRFMRMLTLWNHERLQEEPLADEDWEAAAEAQEAEAKQFWESKRGWFSSKGYTLYEYKGLQSSLPLLDTPYMDTESIEYPYAYCGGDPSNLDLQPLEAYNSGKVYFAQDVQGRHVAIKKLTKADEIRIYRFLWEKREQLAENCVLPIIDILESEGQCFVITPRWGDGPYFLDPAAVNSVEDVLHYIRCLLKAINFLHSNLIVHRDLKEENTLINHFGAFGRERHNLMRPKLRSAGRLTYALFDFDLSRILPSTECRLLSSESFYVLSITWPLDTSHGELDYDPYKFEMGCLGIVLCQMFQHCIPTIPFLAPFLDRLITDRLELRLTAPEALIFFDEMHGTLTPEQLSLEVPVYTLPGYPHWEPEKYNRWEGLPDKFIQEWGHFRAPIPSLYMRFLRRICCTDLGRAFVLYTRHFSRRLKNYFHVSPLITRPKI